MQRFAILFIYCALFSCAPNANRQAPIPATLSIQTADVGLYPGETPRMRVLVNKYADHYNVPRALVHRVIQRESDYNARARNGPYYGLMQILPATARNMGFRGDASQLLDAETNLTFAVKYLRGAWLLSNGSMKRAVALYAKGYYYEARNRCMLVETGLREREVKKHCPNG